jgi:hypothetical protein
LILSRIIWVSLRAILRAAEKSFLFIGSNYMNFAIRLGYHLSTVEAYISDNINDNYIRFFFKGGGAVVETALGETPGLSVRPWEGF